MTAATTPAFSRREPEFDRVVCAAVKELRDARREMLEAKRRLRAADLSPLARGNLTSIHDRAAKRVTGARFALDQALDASETA